MKLLALIKDRLESLAGIIILGSLLSIIAIGGLISLIILAIQSKFEKPEETPDEEDTTRN